jgi:glucose/mannose transport system substrate-binding protein
MNTSSRVRASAPLDQHVPVDKFDNCAKKSHADEQATIKSGGFLPSLASGEIQPSVTADAITEVVTNLMNSDEGSKEGARELAAAAKVKSAGPSRRTAPAEG